MSLPVAVGPLSQLAVGTGAGPLGARKEEAEVHPGHYAPWALELVLCLAPVLNQQGPGNCWNVLAGLLLYGVPSSQFIV